MEVGKGWAIFSQFNLLGHGRWGGEISFREANFGAKEPPQGEGAALEDSLGRLPTCDRLATFWVVSRHIAVCVGWRKT